MVHSNCVTHLAEVIRHEKVGNELIPVQLQLTEASQLVGEHAPDVDTASYPVTRRVPTSNGPISSLFEELLIIIFDDVVTSESSPGIYQHRHATSGWHPLSPPRNLASVSRAWRTVVFACPILWRHVVLTPYQPIDALKEHLCNSSTLPIHLTVHQYWPFRKRIPSSGPYPMVEMNCQLMSILSAVDTKAGILRPACHRVESITINAKSNPFLSFVFYILTGTGNKFSALRHVTINGNVSATWSTSLFFDATNAPALERLELSNVAISNGVDKLPWSAGMNLTTLVWSAPAHEHGSRIISVSCFHHVLSSFPNLTKLELHGQVVGLEFVNLESLQWNGITPLMHIRDLRISGQVFSNGTGAFILFYLLPSLRHVTVRGRACSGPRALRTVTHAVQTLIELPKSSGHPIMLSDLEVLELECVDRSGYAAWKTWFIGEPGTMVRDDHVTRVRIHMLVDEPADADEDFDDHL